MPSSKNSNPTTVSVVIPAYNEETTIKNCLNSLINQTIAPSEIIVIDNNSSDATASIALDCGAKVIKEPKQGIMPATYTGMTAAQCEIIARCDADSILPPNWIETIVSELEGKPGVSGITGPGRFYGISSFFANLAQVWYMYAYFVLVGLALARWPLFGSNFAIRRSVWREVQSNIHRDSTDIHDDMEISIHIPPSQQILFKPSLTVEVSARSLKANGMARRYKKGFRTLTLHWPEQAPWNRWRARLLTSGKKVI